MLRQSTRKYVYSHVDRFKVSLLDVTKIKASKSPETLLCDPHGTSAFGGIRIMKLWG